MGTTVWADMETALWSLDALTQERYHQIITAFPDAAKDHDVILQHSVASRTLRRTLEGHAKPNALDEGLMETVTRLTDEMREQIDTLENLSATHWDDRGKHNAYSYVGSMIALEGDGNYSGHWFVSYVESATEKSISIRPIMLVHKMVRQKPIPLTTLVWERSVLNHGWRMIERSMNPSAHDEYMHQMRARQIRYPWGKNPRMLKVVMPPSMATPAWQKTNTALTSMSTKHQLLMADDPAYRWVFQNGGKHLLDTYNSMVFSVDDMRLPSEIMQLAAWAGLTQDEVRSYMAAERTAQLARNHNWIDATGETRGNGILFDAMPIGVDADSLEPKDQLRLSNIQPILLADPPWVKPWVPA